MAVCKQQIGEWEQSVNTTLGGGQYNDCFNQGHWLKPASVLSDGTHQIKRRVDEKTDCG